jgi:hypothetical protein
MLKPLTYLQYCILFSQGSLSVLPLSHSWSTMWLFSKTSFCQNYCFSQHIVIWFNHLTLLVEYTKLLCSYLLFIFHSLLLCYISLVWFSNIVLFQTKTCWNFQCDTVIRISQEEVCAFCWVRVMNSSLVLSVLSAALSNFIPLKFDYLALHFVSVCLYFMLSQSKCYNLCH